MTGTDIHLVLVPAPPGPPVPTPLPHPFSGTLTGGLSVNVLVNGRGAATVGSMATNSPPHLPTAPGTSFQLPPRNRGTVLRGSSSVFVNGRPVARVGDPVTTCNDPVDAATSAIASGSQNVLVGG